MSGTTASGQKVTGRYWPSRTQELLLVAALAEPPAAMAAWHELPSSFDLDRLEPGSFELLPLIYRNLAQSDAEEPHLPRLKGIYRRTWVKNNLLLERAASVARILQSAGISPLFVEGAVLARRHYPDLGLRPTAVTNILVRPEDAAAAVVRLQRNAWAARPSSGAFPGVRFLFDSTGNTLSLRTAPSFDFSAAHEVGRLWERAEREDIGGTEVLVPDPTDCFASVVAFGARLGPVPRTQWIVDAAMMIRGRELEWERIVSVASRHGQVRRFEEALAYLAAVPNVDPPKPVLEQLASIRSGSRERLIYALSSGSLRGLGGLPEVLAEHLATHEPGSTARSLATLAGRLKDRWGVERNWQLPLAAGRRAIRSAARRRTA